MKTWMFVALLGAGLVGFEGGAQTAAEPGAMCSPMQTPDAATPGGRQTPSPDKMAAMMAAKLSLTADQQAKITPIIADRQQQMMALRSDSSRPMQKKKKMKEIMEGADKKINALLTPEQQKQYAVLEEQMKEQMKERRQEQKEAGK